VARKKVLFICTGNSARSIMAEALMRRLGRGKYQAFSAGAAPTGIVNPLTLQILRRHGHDTAGLSSKPLDRFLDQVFDVVITVCDRARDFCPVWPKKTLVLHWSLEDPAAYRGTEDERLSFFEKIYRQIEKRVGDFLGNKQ
jgi:protein-tyrosine-phosphatase